MSYTAVLTLLLLAAQYTILHVLAYKYQNACRLVAQARLRVERHQSEPPPERDGG